MYLEHNGMSATTATKYKTTFFLLNNKKLTVSICTNVQESNPCEGEIFCPSRPALGLNQLPVK
jgi:hypothetical protein